MKMDVKLPVVVCLLGDEVFNLGIVLELLL